QPQREDQRCPAPLVFVGGVVEGNEAGEWQGGAGSVEGVDEEAGGREADAAAGRAGFAAPKLDLPARVRGQRPFGAQARQLFDKPGASGGGLVAGVLHGGEERHPELRVQSKRTPSAALRSAARAA